MAKLSPLGITHFKITLGDESAAGLFKTVSPQGASVDHDYFPYNSEAGPPVKAWVPTGGHVNYQEPITLERGLDPDKRLWQWIGKVMREYDPESSIAKFKATGVWPSSYKTTDWNASGGSKVAIESLGLSLETWERF